MCCVWISKTHVVWLWHRPVGLQGHVGWQGPVGLACRMVPSCVEGNNTILCDMGQTTKTSNCQYIDEMRLSRYFFLGHQNWSGPALKEKGQLQWKTWAKAGSRSIAQHASDVHFARDIDWVGLHQPERTTTYIDTQERAQTELTNSQAYAGTQTNISKLYAKANPADLSYYT